MHGDEALALYAAARSGGLRPALLESLGPRTPFGRRTLLAAAPSREVELRDGVLRESGRVLGGVAELFELLTPPATPTTSPFFPAWVGFFAYEFARLLDMPAKAPLPGLPDAAFRLYERGWLWEDGRLVERPDACSELAGLAPASTMPSGLPAIELRSDYPADEHIAGVEEVQERIRAGWVYQVNLSSRFHFDARELDALPFYATLRQTNPSPFFGIVEGDGWAVVSGSPERLFRLEDDLLTARPIAGTRPRHAETAEDDALERDLLGDRKEQAEHVMLVDLLRNDLARVSRPGSVEVSEAFTVERYSHVMHLVSEVRGAPRAPFADVMRSIFPGGTITGAPKESVMREIERLEPVPRGAYTGSLGYVSAAGADFNILIRSLTVAGDTAYLSAGGGIVIESDPTTEYLEARHKAEALLHVLGKGRRGLPPAAPRRHDQWRPPRQRPPIAARVLFIECHDSFSFNIVDYLHLAGAEVRVVDHEEAPQEGVDVGAPSETVAIRPPHRAGGDARPHPALAWATHVVTGPGPGEPATSGRLLEWTAAAMASSVPLLGICLGHQAHRGRGGRTPRAGAAARPRRGSPGRARRPRHLRGHTLAGPLHALPLAGARRSAR